MDGMKMLDPRRVAGDTLCFGTYLDVPAFGLVACNSFLIQATESVLVDTGLLLTREPFLDQLRAELPLREIRWIWLTHTDPDHIGALDPLLEEAPDATVVTNFVGMAKLGLQMRAPPPERIHLLNPGERLDVGDRQLVAHVPPTFDAPETTGCLDSRSGAFFSADAFGARLSAAAAWARDVEPAELKPGCVTWATLDSPWLRIVDPAAFDRDLEFIRKLDPPWILSAHLPPAEGMTDTLLGHLSDATGAPPFVGPDQATFASMG